MEKTRGEIVGSALLKIKHDGGLRGTNKNIWILDGVSERKG